MFKRLLIAVIIASALNGCHQTGANSAGQESPAFHRVMQSGILRCGYAVWPSGFMKNEKTGAFYGLMVDFMNEVGRLSNLKIVWDHEVDWGLMREEFDAQKIDAMCAGDWTQAHKLRQVYYSIPLAYDTMVAVVRADDNRFDGDLSKINAAGITISAIENDASDSVAKENFSQARRLYVAPLESEQGCLMNVETRKSDVALVGMVTIAQYMKENPGRLKLVAGVKPASVYPLGIPVGHGDNDMAQLFNVAIDEMHASGFLDRLIERYQKNYPATVYKLNERERIK